MLTEAAVNEGVLRRDAIDQYREYFQAEDEEEPIRVDEVLLTLEHDGYLAPRGDDFQFVSGLLEDWWRTRHGRHFVPVARRLGAEGRMKRWPLPPASTTRGSSPTTELMASFCVRTAEFETMVEVLRECTGASNPHQIVIGPRGSGKTSLLLRIAAEARRDPELAAGFFPVVFAEESYEVSTVGEFWLESLAQLAAQDAAPRRRTRPPIDSRRAADDS